MKASLITLLCFFLWLHQISWATDDLHKAETVHHDVVDCSGDYLDLEHKLNLAYNLLLDSDIDQSLSLYEEIETSLENDEMPIKERICIANRVSKGYYDLYEDEKGLVFASKYLNKAKESLSPDDYLLGKAYESLGALQRRTDDFDSSKENLIHAFEILKSYSHQFLIYHQLGRFYLDTDQLQKSDEFFKLAVDNIDKEDKSLRNIRDQFYVYFGYAITGILTRDYAKAEQRTKKLDALSKKINDPFFNFLVNLKYTEYFLNGIPKTDIALVYLNKPVPDHPFVDHYMSSHYYYFGVTKIIEGEYEKARDFFLQAIENSLSIGGDAQKIGQFYIWLARSYSNMNEPDKTLQAYQDALSYFDETKEKLRTTFAQIENNIGVLYFDQHELGLAKSHYLKSLAWKTERPNSRIRTGTNLVRVHLEYFKKQKKIVI